MHSVCTAIFELRMLWGFFFEKFEKNKDKNNTTITIISFRPGSPGSAPESYPKSTIPERKTRESNSLVR